MSKLKVRRNGSWEWMQTGLTPLPSVPGVSLQSIDGGPNYFVNKGYFKAAPLDDPNFFPIGIWYGGVGTQEDVDKDKYAGINIYVMLDNYTNYELIRQNGMYAMPPYDETIEAMVGDETVGWHVSDELDMRTPIGWEPGQGYAIQQSYINNLPTNDGRFAHNNYGKGILLRTWTAPYSTKVYLNNFQQVVSADLYWYTDLAVIRPQGGQPYNQLAQFYDMYNRDFTADEAKRGSHYGNLVQYVRRFVNPYRSEPVWGFIENGMPSDDPSITLADYMDPEVMKSGVWHMIIAGARGIIYFNHTFHAAGYPSNNNFRDARYSAIIEAGREVNTRVQSLAAVINDSFAINFVTVSPAASVVNGIEIMAKYHAGKFYVFAGSRESTALSTPTNATFTIPNGVGTVATVLFENRTVLITNGQFTDTFANGNTVHIYRID